MKKINDWVIKTFGLRGSWSWAKKQMLNGAIIKRINSIRTNHKRMGLDTTVRIV